MATLFLVVVGAKNDITRGCCCFEVGKSWPVFLYVRTYFA